MQQVSKQLIKGLPRRIALMLLDCGLIVLCYWLAVMLRFDSGDAYRRVEILRAMAPMRSFRLILSIVPPHKSECSETLGSILRHFAQNARG